MSGDNHWLEDLAQCHATVASESAGMETRLLQEIARLQARIDWLENALETIERNAPDTEPKPGQPSNYPQAHSFWQVRRLIDRALRGSKP